MKTFPNSKHPKRAQARRGIALLEIAIALPILTLALGLYAQILLAGSGLRNTGRESWQASAVAQSTLERMRNADFREVFALYNQDPFDDPGGPGTAPGAFFPVEGLRPVADDPDGFVGSVILPAVNVGTAVVPDWQLREDVVDARLEFPRDLDGDVVIDDDDHADDYILLPVRVVVRWQGKHGPREFALQTTLAELR